LTLRDSIGNFSGTGQIHSKSVSAFYRRCIRCWG
jgi:hypothetical protein